MKKAELLKFITICGVCTICTGAFFVLERDRKAGWEQASFYRSEYHKMTMLLSTMDSGETKQEEKKEVEVSAPVVALNYAEEIKRSEVKFNTLITNMKTFLLKNTSHIDWEKDGDAVKAFKIDFGGEANKEKYESVENQINEVQKYFDEMKGRYGQ